MRQSYGRLVFILLGVAVAIYACWKISQRIDAFLYPWADERAGGTVLTGAWIGELAIGSDHRQGVLLELHRRLPQRSEKCPAGCNSIEGTLTTCDDEGLESNYIITGRPVDRRATRLSLQASPGPNPPIDFAGFDALKGQWTGETLDLEVQLHAAEPSREQHQTTHASPAAAAKMQLRRGTRAALNDLCQTVHTQSRK